MLHSGEPPEGSRPDPACDSQDKIYLSTPWCGKNLYCVEQPFKTLNGFLAEKIAV